MTQRKACSDIKVSSPAAGIEFGTSSIGSQFAHHWATVFSQLGTCSSMVRVLPQCARVPGFETWSGYVLLLPRHTNNVFRRNKGSFICYKYNQ